MLSIQHDFCRFQNNWKLGTGKSQTSVSSRQTSYDWENTFSTVIQLGIPRREHGPLSRAPTWRSLTSWFDLVFFQSSQLSWKHHKSRKCHTSRTKFDKCTHDKDHRDTFLFKWEQHNRVSTKMYCMLLPNYVICQEDMYTVAKKVMLSVCCVVSC